MRNGNEATLVMRTGNETTLLMRTGNEATVVMTTQTFSLVPRPSTPNTVEGLVKLVRRMTLGGRLEVWHFR